MATLGELLALVVTNADEQDRVQVEGLCAAVQEATGDTIELAYADQRYTGETAAGWGIPLEVVKPLGAKRGFVLPPRRWVAERSQASLAVFRRLDKEYELLPQTLAGLQLVAFSILMFGRMLKLLMGDSA